MDIKEYQDSFHRAMLPRGGRYDPVSAGYDNDNPTFAQKMIDEARESPQTKALNTMPYVHFDLIANTSLNACAFAFEGKEFIGLHAGTIPLLCDLYFRALAHPNVLPEIGSIEHETTEGLEIPRLVCDLQEATQFKDVPTEIVRPKDPDRFQYAQLLARYAFCFLIEHEIAHLRYGHIVWLNSLHGTALIDEMAWSGGGIFSPMTNQALEMDADSWPAVQAAIRMLRASAGDGNLLTSAYFDNLTDNLLFDWFFAIYLLFRLFDRGRPHVSQPENQSYPSPQMRRIMIGATIGAFFERETGEECNDRIGRVFGDAVGKGERAILAIAPSDTFAREFATTYDPVDETRRLEHFAKINQEYKMNVYPALVPLTRARDLVIPE